jgi:hypothetical protein
LRPQRPQRSTFSTQRTQVHPLHPLQPHPTPPHPSPERKQVIKRARPPSLAATIQGQRHQLVVLTRSPLAMPWWSDSRETHDHHGPKRLLLLNAARPPRSFSVSPSATPPMPPSPSTASDVQFPGDRTAHQTRNAPSSFRPRIPAYRSNLALAPGHLSDPVP